MPKPTEHKSVQARILKYAQDIHWRFVTQAEAEQRSCATISCKPTR
jgi:type I restriction enzyme R subunit